MLRLAVAAHLARYKGETRVHTALDLISYLHWWLERSLNPLNAGRAHIELYLRWLQEVPGASWSSPRLHNLRHRRRSCM
jgi:integrase/recombinase XerD